MLCRGIGEGKAMSETKVKVKILSILQNHILFEIWKNKCGIIWAWFKIDKGLWQGCILSPCFLFNFCAEYIMWNARMDESQTGIKNGRRNINNLRYVGDATLMAESEEKLKSLLMSVKEESKKKKKTDLKNQHFKT